VKEYDTLLWYKEVIARMSSEEIEELKQERIDNGSYDKFCETLGGTPEEIKRKYNNKPLTEVKEWITEYLEKPNENFGGMPVCPFVKAEREKDELMFEIWYPNETSFVEILKKFKDSNFSSALIICMNTEGILWEEVDRKKYQKTIQSLMKEHGYKDIKALCFSPFEHHTAAGEETRKGSPYFLINIAGRDDLNKAHRKLLKTSYFDKFSDEEVKTLKVYPKNKEEKA
jgi:hypothetical protein